MATGSHLWTVRLRAAWQRSTSGFCHHTTAHAVFGNKIEIPTLDGKSTLKIPPGIQSGKLLRMRGKGFPMLRSSSKGDQIVRVVVETPSSVSRGSKKIIESLRDELSPIKNPYSKIDL